MVVARTGDGYARRLGLGGVGFMEDPTDYPQTPQELFERHREDLVKSFPMLDGIPPAPTLLDAVTAKWPTYLASRARQGGGHEHAYRALKVWVGEMAQRHRVQWEREGSPVTPRIDPIYAARIASPEYAASIAEARAEADAVLGVDLDGHGPSGACVSPALIIDLAKRMTKR